MDEKQFLEGARHLLSVLIKLAGLTRYEIDDRIGRSRGYTGQVLSGRINITLEFVRAVMVAIGFDPEVYFRLLFGPGRHGRIGAEEIMAALEEQRVPPARHEEPPPERDRPPTLAEIEALLERKLAPLGIPRPEGEPPPAGGSS